MRRRRVRHECTVATLIALPTIFALVQGWAGRESASLDPDDPASPHYHEEEDEAQKSARHFANGEPQLIESNPHPDGPGPSSKPSAEQSH